MTDVPLPPVPKASNETYSDVAGPKGVSRTAAPTGSFVTRDRFRGRTTLISGGAGGIGLAISRRILAEGGIVIVFDLDLEPLRELQKEYGPERLFGRIVDITDRLAVETAVAEVAKTVGPVTVLVNNAGRSAASVIEEVSDADLDIHFAINVKGAVFLTQAVIPGMKLARIGSIVNVSSVLGIIGHLGTTAYAASKAALAHLARTWAVELAQSGIRVNTVCLGYVNTPRMLSQFKEITVPETVIRYIERKHPLGRLASPEEAAAAITFLASEEASFISGAILAVDGGYTAW